MMITHSKALCTPAFYRALNLHRHTDSLVWCGPHSTKLTQLFFFWSGLIINFCSTDCTLIENWFTTNIFTTNRFFFIGTMALRLKDPLYPLIIPLNMRTSPHTMYIHCTTTSMSIYYWIVHANGQIGQLSFIIKLRRKSL